MLRPEIAISRVLKYGVLVCGALLAVGLFLGFAQSSPDFSREFFLELLSGKVVPSASWTTNHGPAFIIGLGLACLVALPIIRVFATLVLFVRERDHTYVAITAFTLIVLLAGLLIGRGL